MLLLDLHIVKLQICVVAGSYEDLSNILIAGGRSVEGSFSHCLKTFAGLTASASKVRKDGLLASQPFCCTPVMVERVGSASLSVFVFPEIL